MLYIMNGQCNSAIRLAEQKHMDVSGLPNGWQT